MLSQGEVTQLSRSIIIIGLELAPLDSKVLPLTNLGYGNVYRVNYSARIWERILRHLEEAPHLFSFRAKAQLLNDFCFFASKGNDD